MVSPVRLRFTYQDYPSIPEMTPRRFELLDGERVRAPAASVMHQSLSGQWFILLYRALQAQGPDRVFYAPLDVVLSETDGVSPDMVVEMLSPATEARDRGCKKTPEARYGVREYWRVTPRTRRWKWLA